MTISFMIKYKKDKDWTIINPLLLIKTGSGAFVDTDDKCLKIWTPMNDDTMIQLEIQPKYFNNIAQAMIDADPDAAIKAFGRALVIGARRPVYDDDGRELG